MRSNGRPNVEPINEVAERIKELVKRGGSTALAQPAPAAIPGKPLYSYTAAEVAAFIATCPACSGIGYIKAGEDLPFDSEDFGKLIPCPACREWTLEQRRRDDWRRLKPFIEASDCLQGDLLQCTFDNFQDKTPSLQGIKKAVRDWAMRVYKQTDGRRWLYLCGACGCGKTHLCAAAANGLRAAGVSVLFMTTPVLLGTLKADLNRTEDFINQLSVVPVLVLDDLGTEPLTEWAASILFRIIDGRYTTRRPLLVSSNLTLERLGSERIASRLGDVRLCEVIVNPAPDWRKGAK
jgi:DNA replication protein DnaC